MNNTRASRDFKLITNDKVQLALHKSPIYQNVVPTVRSQSSSEKFNRYFTHTNARLSVKLFSFANLPLRCRLFVYHPCTEH